MTNPIAPTAPTPSVVAPTAPTPSVAQPLDQDVINVAKAIRQQETGNKPIAGKTGELPSRYQFLPSTWAEGAQKYLGDANAPLTLENENTVAYNKIKAWKDQGYNVGQIASLWNSGKPNPDGNVGTNNGVHYDTPTYVKNVYANYQKFKGETQQSTQSTQQNQSQQPSLSSTLPTELLRGITQPVEFLEKAGATLGQAAANSAPGKWLASKLGLMGNQNVAQKAQQFQQGMQHPITLPTQSTPLVGSPAPFKSGSEALGSGIQAAANVGGLMLAPEAPVTAFGGIGALGTLGSQIEQNKPINLGDITTSGLLAAGTAGVIKHIPDIANLAGEGSKFALGKASGLGTKTIDTILNPETAAQFAEARASGLGREGLTNQVTNKFNDLQNELSGLGKAYEPIRASGATVDIPQGYWQQKLADAGIVLKNGEVDRQASKVMTNADKNAIDDFLQNYSKEGQTTADEFLRSREALANIAKYDAAKTPLSAEVSRDLRQSLNSDFRGSIPGLAQADAEFAPVKQFFEKIKPDLMTKGEFKPNIFSKIANAGNKTNQAFLAKLEQLSPGITNNIKVLSALEDVEFASGQKVGAYAQHILFSGSAGLGLSGGNPLGALVGIIASNPNFIVPILEKFALVKNLSADFISKLGQKILSGIKPNAEESKIVSEAMQEAAKDPVFTSKPIPPAEPSFQSKPLPKLPPENNPSLILPERATPPKIELPAKGILEGQRKLAEKPSGMLQIKPNIEASQKAAGIYKEPIPETLYHGSEGGKLKVDNNGNINLTTDQEASGRFGKSLSIPTNKLNIKDVGTKKNLFNIASDPKQKENLIKQGIDVISAENHQIAIDPKSLSEKTNLPLRDQSIRQKTISELQTEEKAKEFTNSKKYFQILPESYLKIPKKVFRGVSETGGGMSESGKGASIEGYGLYTTTKRNVAEGYAKSSGINGKVLELGKESLPIKPIYFRDSSAVKDWTILISKEIGINPREFESKIGINNLVRSLGYDGIAFDMNGGTTFVKYPENKIKFNEILDKAHKKGLLEK